MIITCGNCLAKFKVAPELIKETGSKVRCSNCRHVFTVYRPQSAPAPAEKPVTERAALASRDKAVDPLSDFLNDLSPKKENLGPKPLADDFSFLEEERTSRAGSEKSVESKDDFDLSIFDDDDDLDDFGLGDEDPRPPLRRGRVSARAAGKRGEGFSAEDDGLGPEDGFFGAGQGLRAESGGGREDGLKNLGLDEDPAFDSQAAAARTGGTESPLAAAGDGEKETPYSSGLEDEPSEEEGGGETLEESEGRPEGGGKGKAGSPAQMIFLILAVLATLLAVGIFVMANFSGSSNTVALSGGDPNQSPPEENGAPALAGGLSTEIPSTSPETKLREKIELPATGQVRTFLRTNKKAGDILILTGLLRNRASQRVSFIRVKGRLEDNEGVIRSEREVYAGNVLSDEDLTSLPMNEIQTRLAIKGGQNGANMNLEPGRDVPFMLVFDKVPQNLQTYTYHIEIMSVEPGLE